MKWLLLIAVLALGIAIVAPELYDRIGMWYVVLGTIILALLGIIVAYHDGVLKQVPSSNGGLAKVTGAERLREIMRWFLALAALIASLIILGKVLPNGDYIVIEAGPILLTWVWTLSLIIAGIVFWKTGKQFPSDNGIDPEDEPSERLNIMRWLLAPLAALVTYGLLAHFAPRLLHVTTSIGSYGATWCAITAVVVGVLVFWKAS